MSKPKRHKSNQTRAAPSAMKTFLCSISDYDSLCSAGYIQLSKCPEIISAVEKIADIISGITIHLRQNTENGDIRIKNELSRKIDICPNKNMTKKTFISALVRGLLLEGDGNMTVTPLTKDGLLNELIIIPPGDCVYIPEGYDYKIKINGTDFDPQTVLHFAINPDPSYSWKGTGYRTSLKEVARTLKQASDTKKGFMESKWKPSIIVKVDSNADEFSSREGRKKLLEQYVQTSAAGEPWLLPAEEFEIQEVRPLSLNDIAIESSVKLDKRTVAAILDVPPFIVGEGTFKADEWNNFISTRIKSICNVIEQECTKKLIINPNWYFKFNIRSAYSYDIKLLSGVGYEGYVRGIITGNEVRDWLDLSPKEGLDKLVILENYIPLEKIAEQNKLNGGGE